MDIVKIRRVGNSNVITLPRSLEKSGFHEGAQVVIDQLDNGDLILRTSTTVRERIRELGRRAIIENGEALRLLKEYDEKW